MCEDAPQKFISLMYSRFQKLILDSKHAYCSVMNPLQKNARKIIKHSYLAKACQILLFTPCRLINTIISR